MLDNIVKITTEDNSEIHCISFERGKTICGLEYFSSDEDIEISYPKGGIKSNLCALSVTN